MSSNRCQLFVFLRRDPVRPADNGLFADYCSRHTRRIVCIFFAVDLAVCTWSYYLPNAFVVLPCSGGHCVVVVTDTKSGHLTGPLSNSVREMERCPSPTLCVHCRNLFACIIKGATAFSGQNPLGPLMVSWYSVTVATKYTRWAEYLLPLA